MNKFNEQKQIEETTEFQIGELMNEVNNEIQVNDKVQWIAFKGMEDVVMKGCVEGIGEFNGVKTFTIRKFPELGFSKGTQTMVTASRVTKLGRGH